ncbi:TPA: hypothetical protein ACKTGI_002758 [Pseudomonas aeruginosa]
MINNQIQRDKRLDNLKGIDSDKASIRATEIKEREEFFMLQHIIALLGMFFITYCVAVGLLYYSKNLQDVNGSEKDLVALSILTFSLSILTLCQFFYATKRLIFFLAEYVSLLKVITHTAAISASATALLFFMDSEPAMNHVKYLKSQFTIIDQYFLYPVWIYITFFSVIALYHFHNNLFKETKAKEIK